jgi:hypothetical protein
MLISSFETITDRWKDLLSSDFYEILSTEQEELNQEIRNLVTNTKFKGFQDGWDIAEAGKR